MLCQVDQFVPMSRQAFEGFLQSSLNNYLCFILLSSRYNELVPIQLTVYITELFTYLFVKNNYNLQYLPPKTVIFFQFTSPIYIYIFWWGQSCQWGLILPHTISSLSSAVLVPACSSSWEPIFVRNFASQLLNGWQPKIEHSGVFTPEKLANIVTQVIHSPESHLLSIHPQSTAPALVLLTSLIPENKLKESLEFDTSSVGECPVRHVSNSIVSLHYSNLTVLFHYCY